MTTTIKADDLVEPIAAALQYVSYYHPRDGFCVAPGSQFMHAGSRLRTTA
jgi:hypothetical protein